MKIKELLQHMRGRFICWLTRCHDWCFVEDGMNRYARGEITLHDAIVCRRCGVHE